MLSGLLKDLRKTFSLHTVSAHFSNGLIPVAVLYFLLTLPSGDAWFDHTVKHLLIIVLPAIPVSFFSGLHDWKTRYKSAKAPVFIKKIRLSIVLFVLCVISTLIRCSMPEVTGESGLLHWVYTVTLLSMLPVVSMLGYYGGKLSAGQRQAGAKK